MPKMKTKKAMQARFKMTGTGKLVRQKPGRRHKLTKKSSARKRSLGREAVLTKPQTKLYGPLISA